MRLSRLWRRLMLSRRDFFKLSDNAVLLCVTLLSRELVSFFADFKMKIILIISNLLASLMLGTLFYEILDFCCGMAKCIPINIGIVVFTTLIFISPYLVPALLITKQILEKSRLPKIYIFAVCLLFQSLYFAVISSILSTMLIHGRYVVTQTNSINIMLLLSIPATLILGFWVAKNIFTVVKERRVEIN